MTIDQPLDQPLDRPLSTGSPAPAPTGGPPTSRARILIIGSGLALAAATVAVLLGWLPWGERNEFGYEAIAPIRDTAWLGILLDGLAMGVLAITVSLATCLLASGRGARWADVGAVVTIIGGLAFAMGAFARGAVSWFATAEAVGADAGSTVLTLVQDQEPGRLTLVAMAGFLLITVGTLVLAVAWWRSRTVPRWLPVTLAVLTVAQFTGFDGRALDVLQILLMVVFIVFAVIFVIRTRPVG